MRPGRVEARDDEALPTTVLVFVFTADVIPLVCASVFAFTTAAIDDDAVPTIESVLLFTELTIPLVAEFVFAFMTAASELEAVVTSLAVASDPESSPAPVSVRVAFDQTSATSVPKPESVRDV